jgi:hypothetical protein
LRVGMNFPLFFEIRVILRAKVDILIKSDLVPVM